MIQKLKELKTPKEVVDTGFLGERYLADVIGVTFKAVNNWKNATSDGFPAIHYAKMIWELNQRGYTASPRLWRQAGTEGLRLRRITK